MKCLKRRVTRVFSALVATSLIFALSSGALAATAKVIRFSDLESTILKNNVGIQIANNAVNKAKEKTTEYNDPHIALYNQATMVMQQRDAQLAMAEMNKNPTQAIEYYYQSMLDQIDRQLDSLGDTNDALADAVTAAENARDNALAAQLSAAKTLYVTVHTIDRGIDSARNSMSILKSQKDRVKKIVDAGFAPSSNLDKFDLQLDAINAQIKTAVGQRDTTLVRLKAILGLPMSDNISVGDMPKFDFKKIDSISYSSDLSSCLSKNLDIKQKERTFKEIDAGNKKPTQVDITTARLSVEQAKISAEVNFKNAYEEMVKGWTLLKEDQKALADKRDKLAKAENQLSLGLIPASTVKNQKDEISNAEFALKLSEVQLALICQNYENLKLGY